VNKEDTVEAKLAKIDNSFDQTIKKEEFMTET
jgi:hypothetical protein